MPYTLHERYPHQSRHPLDKGPARSPEPMGLDPKEFDTDKRYTIWERVGDSWVIDRSHYGAFYKSDDVTEWRTSQGDRLMVLEEGYVPNGLSPAQKGASTKRSKKQLLELQRKLQVLSDKLEENWSATERRGSVRRSASVISRLLDEAYEIVENWPVDAPAGDTATWKASEWSIERLQKLRGY
jgi:hypothetical protein